MVIPISNTTKVCDIGTTTIYRANPHNLCMCDELEFHCIYCQSLLLVEFPLYIPHAKQQQRCKSMKGKCLETNSKHKPFPLNPLKLLSHWHRLPKWVTSSRRQI